MQTQIFRAPASDSAPIAWNVYISALWKCVWCQKSCPELVFTDVLFKVYTPCLFCTNFTGTHLFTLVPESQMSRLISIAYLCIKHSLSQEEILSIETGGSGGKRLAWWRWEKKKCLPSAQMKTNRVCLIHSQTDVLGGWISCCSATLTEWISRR